MKTHSHHFFIQSKKGLTVTELLIAIGLTSIVGLGISQVLLNSKKIENALIEKLDDQIESKLGDKLLTRDLRNAGVSLNNITIKDDSGLPFFEYVPDRSTLFYNSVKNKKRTYTLSIIGKKNFYFISADNLRGKGLFADAVTFFEVGAPPLSPSEPAALTYRGLNYKNYLTAKDAQGQFINNPALINSVNLGKLILVDSSSYMPTVPQRPAVFIGRLVKKADIYDVEKIPTASIPSNSDGNKIFNYSILTPVGSYINPSNFEDFMYNLPPVGANGASVRIKPIRMYKYSLECSTNKPASCILYRSDVLHGESKQKIPILKGFGQIKFIRDDIATSVFQIDVSK